MQTIKAKCAYQLRNSGQEWDRVEQRADFHPDVGSRGGERGRARTVADRWVQPRVSGAVPPRAGRGAVRKRGGQSPVGLGSRPRGRGELDVSGVKGMAPTYLDPADLGEGAQCAPQGDAADPQADDEIPLCGQAVTRRNQSELDRRQDPLDTFLVHVAAADSPDATAAGSTVAGNRGAAMVTAA